jgi:hypothetical protein
VLASEPVADAIRKELRRRTGQNVEVKEISRLLTETVVRPEWLDAPDVAPWGTPGHRRAVTTGQ